MSDDRDENEIITNNETLARRAWVERALEGVRRRLRLDAELPETAAEPPEKPQLYVVPSSRKR